MARFKLTDLGNKTVVMASDGSGWRIVEAAEVKTAGACPACGVDTAASPGVYYTVPRPRHKGKEPLALCTHQPAEVEEAQQVLAGRS